jgi:hypothetical protein
VATGLLFVISTEPVLLFSKISIRRRIHRRKSDANSVFEEVSGLSCDQNVSQEMGLVWREKFRLLGEIGISDGKI